MIIVQLSGGMGNQMFQYALGSCLAEKRSDELVLHTGLYSTPQCPRKYALDCFKIRAQVSANLNFVKPPGFSLFWMVREVEFGFHREVLECSQPNLMLSGYWQSERYFAEIRSRIRADFAFKNVRRANGNSDLANRLGSMESVCVHVRRGDYLRPGDQRGFLGRAYYQRAVQAMATRVKNPVFYVFSDDIDWCRKNIELPYPQAFVPSENEEEHLKLMTRCKHFIIANSTFSWWAAWLATNPGKLIVAPKRWFRKSSGLCSADLIPKDWITV